jgi:hypothetical protein
LWLAVASEDVARAKEVLEARWRDGLDEQQQAIADGVLDFNAAEMTCPACLTAFPTGPQACPECGLQLA